MEGLIAQSVELAKRAEAFHREYGRDPMVLGVDELTWAGLKARLKTTGKLRTAKFRGITLAPMAGHVRP